jgi:hypothetical protein
MDTGGKMAGFNLKSFGLLSNFLCTGRLKILLETCNYRLAENMNDDQ